MSLWYWYLYRYNSYIFYLFPFFYIRMTYGKLISKLGSNHQSHYGFVNETAIRVGASIMFTIGFFTFWSVYYAGMYQMALVIVSWFFIDFVLKVINPDYSFINQIAIWLTKHKKPVWVWAIQKRFAWAIGLIMSAIVLIALIYRVVIIQDLSYIPQTLSWPMYLCIMCLIFMRLESTLGRCAGCRIYEFLVRHRFTKNTDHQHCPDEWCNL